MDTGAGGLDVSSGEDERCTRDADVWPGVAAADAEVAMAGFTASCANRSLGCGSTDAEVEVEAETWFAPVVSSSALAISFVSEISPIYKVRESTL